MRSNWLLFSMQSIDYISLISGFSVSRNVLLVANRNVSFVVSEKALAEGEAQIHLGRMLAVLQVIFLIVSPKFEMECGCGKAMPSCLH